MSLDLPWIQVDADLATGGHSDTGEGDPEVGYALEIWEGYAADPEIRRLGSSGGLLSALALYCLEKEGMAVCPPHRNGRNQTLDQ